MKLVHIGCMVLLSTAVVQGCSCRKSEGGRLDQITGDVGLIGFDGSVVAGEITYDFGSAYMGQSKTLDLRVKNISNGMLTLQMLEKLEGDLVAIGESSESPHPVFQVDFQVNKAVGAAETFTLRATFSPPVQPAGKKLQEHSVKLRLKAANVSAGKEYSFITLTGRGVSEQCEVPAAVDFGSVTPGKQYTQWVALNNRTDVSVTAFVGEITGPDALAFRLSVDSPRGSFDIPPGTTRLVTVQFEPEALKNNVSRDYQATVLMRAVEQCPQVPVALTGRAVKSVLEWDPAVIDFGYVTPGVEVQKDITVTNTGNSDIVFSSVRTLTPAEFRMVSSTGPDLTRLSLAGKGGTGKLRIAFRPSVLGPRSTQLAFDTNLPDLPKGSVAMTGYGGGPDIQVNPSPSLNFGRVAYFASMPTSQTRKISVLNVGTKPAVANPAGNLRLGRNGTDQPYGILKISGSTQEGEMTLVPPSQYDGANGLIAGEPGKNLAEFWVKLTPRSVGLKEAEVTLFSNDPDEAEVKIRVTADVVVLPPCRYSLRPSNLNFGLITPPDYKQLSFKVKNLGTAAGDICILSNIDLAMDSDAAFSLPGGPVDSKELAAGEEYEVVTRVWPQTAGTSLSTIDGAVEFYVSSPTSPVGRVMLDANVGSSCLTIAPDDLDFGTVRRGCRSAYRTFNVYNTCTGSVWINSFRIQDAAGQQPGGPNCAGAAACPEFFLNATPPIPTSGLELTNSATPLTFQAYYRPLDLGADRGAIALDVRQNNTSVKYVVTLGGTGDVIGRNTDTFKQDAKPKADILLTVDDSGSMENVQSNLAANFASFIKYANQKAVDYQIGVTTTDMKNVKGRLLGDARNPKILKSTTEDVETLFRSKVNVGTLGDSLEQAFDASLAALTWPMITQDNAGFLRDEANLAVVAVSDELEQSSRTTTFFYNSFLNIKGFKRATAFTFNAIAGFTKPAGCSAELDNGRYAQLVSLTSGVRESICTTDWAKTLEQLGKTAFGYRSTFYLNATPDVSGTNQITVSVDGTALPAVDTLGSRVWSYDSLSNAITFAPNYVPEPGQTLTVSYAVTCF